MTSSFVLNSTAWQGRYMYVLCEQVKNIPENKSTINWTLTVTGGTANYYSTGPTTVTINGQQVYYAPRKGYTSREFPAAKGSVSGSLVVSHGVDGKLSIPVSIATAIYDDVVITTSDTWTLSEIPRGLAIDNAPDFNDTQNPTITYKNYSGSNVTSAQACISLTGSKDDVAYRDISITGTSYTFNLSDAERNVLRAATVGSNKRAVTFYIKTVVDGITLYSTSTKTFTVINATPTIAPTVIDTNTATISLTGDENTIVKGYSNIRFAANATAYKQASIKSINVSCGTLKSTAASGTFNKVPSNIFEFAATDTRNNTVKQTITKNVIDYIPVTCTQKVAIELSGETEAKVNLEISGKYFNGAANTLKLEVRHTRNDSTMGDWVELTDGLIPEFNGNTYKLTTTISGFNYDEAYTFQCRATDKLTNATTGEYTVKLIPVFDWSNSDFNFNVPVTMPSLSVGGGNVDSIIEQELGEDWSYRKWASGIAECWCNTSGTASLSNNMNGFYYTPSISVDYPFTFADKPTVIIDGGSTSHVTLSREFASNVGYARFILLGNAQVENISYSVKIHAIGRWK